MRPYIIVSVVAGGVEGSLDVEVPTNVPAKKLAADIAEQINGYQSKTVLGMNLRLRCERIKRYLSSEETFADAGIWSGDTIYLG